MDRPSSPLKKKKTPNAANGLNGPTKPSPSSRPSSSSSSSLDNHAAAHQAKLARRRPGLVSRLFNLVARLLTWYSIITILFRCPPSLDACNDESPRICRPYFHVRNAVAPYLEPYYDAYAAPYADIVRPYYVAVDESLVSPAWAYTKQHASPHLQQLQAVVRTRWDTSVQPHVDQYYALAKVWYDETLAPHVAHAAAAAQPYYVTARANVVHVYHGAVVPAYRFAHPHLVDGYRAASAFARDTLVPTAVWAWDKTYAFLNGTVGPHIRAVYTENVEPQLVKIGKRLGRYNNSPTKKTVPKPPRPSQAPANGAAGAADSTTSFSKPVVSAPASPSSPSSPSATPTSPIPPPEVDEKLEQEDPHRREAREIIAADLRDWQERYSKAADEGLAEIDDRVQDIAKRMIRREARVTGRDLLARLQTAAASRLADLRVAIRDIVATVAEGSATPDEGRDAIVAAVRGAGMAVKERAQAVRAWREGYDAEMQAAVTSAAETHFAILENIRDLALQKIGMKWAWMDGVTYKDWAKYHLLKSRFDEWKGDLEKHVVSHPSLEAAQLEAANIEEEAMETAAATAKELARLKQVAQWKLAAGDASEEFDSEVTRKAAEAAAEEKKKPVAHDGPAVEDEPTAEQKPLESTVASSEPAAASSPSSEDTKSKLPAAADDAKPAQAGSDTPAAGTPEAVKPVEADPPKESTPPAADKPAEPTPLSDPTDPSVALDAAPDLASTQILDAPVLAVVESGTEEPQAETKEGGEPEPADAKASHAEKPAAGQKKPLDNPEAAPGPEPADSAGDDKAPLWKDHL
ncbi:hypothetical protein VTJ83DRAFT_2776 [Remersonia thermophila]|uniref:Transcription factor hoxa13 n=1 Tax=Remersonia thermophila TaxID=72144 RepID=A0ABR4DJW9_9PEZI